MPSGIEPLLQGETNMLKVAKVPPATNATKVAMPLREACPIEGRVALVSAERMDKTLLVPIENPSARRFAKPRTRITVDESAAPATLEITTNVVTIPSFAP